MDASTRLAFNMKVLRRHDKLISDIVESASFVVLYEHVDEQWQKLGIEGPMFLYKRSVAPTYGFFILNRNGLENFSKSLIAEDDLEVTGNFIIYQDAKVDRVLGLWVYEADHLKKLGAQMLKLKNLDPGHADATGIFAGPSAAQASPKPASTQAGQSVDLDVLFGTTAPTHTQSQMVTGPPREAPAPANGLSLLDSIFKSASTQEPRPPSASRLPAPAPQPVVTTTNAQRGGTDDLKSMLGLGAGPSVPAPPPAIAPVQLAHPSAPMAAPAVPGLEALFASARLSPAVQHPTQNSNSHGPVPPHMLNGDPRPTFAAAVGGGMAPRKQGMPVLSQGDFVREVLSLIHTDPAFVNDIYQRYLAHVH